MRQPTTTWRAAGAVTLCLVATGCSHPQEEPARDIAVYDAVGSEGMTEELTGVLVRERGCTYLDLPDGTRIVLVFPQSARARWDGQELRVGSQKYRVGSDISLGGGGAHDAGSLPEGCDASLDRFLVAP